MDLSDSPVQAELRAEVRAFLAEHKDQAPTHGDDISEDGVAKHRSWQRLLAENGFAACFWPKEAGGRGLGPVEQVVIDQELTAAGVPGVLDFIGVGMMGPTLMAHGSQEQKERFLSPMLHGDEVWCQLFSEPAAGSDLAAVQTRAKQQDDGTWLVNGQKVWTTNAQFSSFGMMLARTDPSVPKHKGLTMFAVPMDLEGIKVVPLRQVGGDAHFNEVFLDDVVLPEDSVVGSVGDGWKVALTTLMYERLTLATRSGGFGLDLGHLAKAIADDAGAAEDHKTRARLGELGTELLAMRFAGYRNLTLLASGRAPGPEAGLAKVTLVQSIANAADLAVDVLGPDALEGTEWADLTSLVPGFKSAGGTEQILSNTIGERVLGLPPEPRMDKDVAFEDLKTRATA